MTGFEIAQVRVKVGDKWVTVPQSSQLEWKLKTDMYAWPDKVDVEVTWKSTYVTFTYAAEPLQTEVFLDEKLKGHATMGDWTGNPAWVYTFPDRPKSGSFFVMLHDVLGSNDVWSKNQKITLKPIVKIFFPRILVNEPVNGHAYPAGTATVMMVINPLIPKKPPVTRAAASTWLPRKLLPFFDHRFGEGPAGTVKDRGKLTRVSQAFRCHPTLGVVRPVNLMKGCAK